jgi:nitroimidazol reductase NimA-like FMN-containing flavoprotein (pyridoxamine 5'-phosphate oxidase superfamily)
MMSAFPDLSPDDLYRSLMEPIRYGPENTLYCSMASLRKDGSPLVIPLGFWYDREYFYITISPGRSSVTRLRRDARVSLCFHTWTFPARFITVEGLAEEIPDPDYAMSLRISHRYPKGHVVDEAAFDRNWLSLGKVLFRIRPIRATGTPFDHVAEDYAETALLPNERHRLKAP